MYSTYTRLPSGWIAPDGSSASEVDTRRPRFLVHANDLSSSLTLPAFAVHIYDSPNSEYFRRRAIADPCNTGIVSLMHPVSNFWNASSVPYFYHLPLTIRAFNPAAMLALARIRGGDKHAWRQVWRMRLYGVQHKSINNSAYNPLTRRLLPFSLRTLSPNEQHQPSPCARRGSGSSSYDRTRRHRSANASSVTMEWANPLSVRLFTNCSINYTRMTANTMFAKIQVPVREMYLPDDASHQTTEVDEMNEFAFDSAALPVNRWRNTLWLENKLLRTETLLASSASSGGEVKPWFEMPAALCHAETYVCQHLLPLPTASELHDVISNGLNADEYYSEYGIPGNLMQLPVYERQLRRYRFTPRHMSVFSPVVVNSMRQVQLRCKSRRQYLQMVPTLERHSYVASTYSAAQICCTECVQLFRVGGHDIVYDSYVRDTLTGRLGLHAAMPLGYSQVFYSMLGDTVATNASSTIGPRDIVFVLALEALPQ